MQKHIFLILVIALSFTVSAQKGFQKELDSVNTVEKAQRFINSIDGIKNKIITFNEEKHKTKLSEELLEHDQKEDIKWCERKRENVHYKVLEKNED